MNSKSKSLPMLPGAIALLAGALALSVSIASTMPAFSQSNNPATPPQRDRMRVPNFLNLTSEQQAQIEQIRQNERSQIDTILTADQKAQLQREWANRKPPTGENRRTPSTEERQGLPPSPFASLNLTDEQRSQIEAVKKSSKEQMDAVLTPEQRQQLQQFQQQHPMPSQPQTR